MEKGEQYHYKLVITVITETTEYTHKINFNFVRYKLKEKIIMYIRVHLNCHCDDESYTFLNCFSNLANSINNIEYSVENHLSDITFENETRILYEQEFEFVKPHINTIKHENEKIIIFSNFKIKITENNKQYLTDKFNELNEMIIKLSQEDLNHYNMNNY